MSNINKKRKFISQALGGIDTPRASNTQLPAVTSLSFTRAADPRTMQVTWVGGGSRQVRIYNDSDTLVLGANAVSPYTPTLSIAGKYRAEVESEVSSYVYALTDAPTGDLAWDEANDRLVLFTSPPVSGGSFARFRMRKNSGAWSSYLNCSFDSIIYLNNGSAITNPDSFAWDPGDVIDLQVVTLVNTAAASPDTATAGEAVTLTIEVLPNSSTFEANGGDAAIENVFELENDITNYGTSGVATLATGASLTGNGLENPFGVLVENDGCLVTQDAAAATDFMAIVCFKSVTFPGTGTQPTEQQMLQKYVSVASNGRFRFQLKNQYPRAWTYVNSSSSLNVAAEAFQKALNAPQFLTIMRDATAGTITIWNEAGESITGSFGTHALITEVVKFFLTEGNGQMIGYFALSANQKVAEDVLYSDYWEPARLTVNSLKGFSFSALSAPSIPATLTYAEGGSAFLDASGGFQKSGSNKYTYAKVSGTLTVGADGEVSGGTAGDHVIGVTATDARGTSSGTINVTVTVTATGTGSGYDWDFAAIPGLPTPSSGQVASGALPSGWTASDNSGTYYGGGTARPAHSASGGSTDVSRKYYLRRGNGAIYSKANKTGAAIATLPSDAVASWDFEVEGLLWYQDNSTRELKSLQITDNGGGSFSTSTTIYADLAGFNSAYSRSQTKIFFGGESEGIVCGRTVVGEGKFVFVHTYNNSTLCVLAAYNVAAHTTKNSAWCTNTRTETVQVSGSYFDFGGMAELGNAAGIKSRPQSTSYTVPYYFWRVSAAGLSARITASENGVGHSWAGTMVIAGVATPVWMGPQGTTMKVYNMLTGAKVAEYTIEGDFSSQGHGGPIKGTDWSYCTDSSGNATAFKNDGTLGSALGTGFIKTSTSDSNLDIEGINPNNLSQACIVSYASPAGPIRERTYSN